MADQYNIKIGVDGSAAERGVKAFTSSISDAMKALRAFDKASRGVFDGLKKLSAIDTNNLNRSFRGTAQAIEALNRVKLSKSLVNNLQMLQRTLANFRFNTDALKRVPEAMAALSRIKVDPHVITTLTQLRAAMIGWKSPPAAAVRNLSALATSLNTVNPAKITAAAAALQRLNGLNLRSRASLPNFGAASSGLSSLRSNLMATTSVANKLRTALAGVSVVAVARGINETGNSFVTLQRTLGAVATSSDEVADHLKFLSDLTGKMPVSLSTASEAYGKFAVAARLSGVSAADTQKVFAGFSTAFAAMGVGAENQKYAFVALEQIFSKGTVQAEELRQQLGDHLPGALNLLADSLGVPTAKLMKMMQQGTITSDSLIKMADTVQGRFGPALAAAMNSSQAQIVSLGNAWTGFQRIVFDSGFNAGLGAMAKQFAQVLNSDAAKQFAADVGAALGDVFKAVGATAKVLSDNADKVAVFFKAFAGYVAVASAVTALRLLASPIILLAPLATAAATAFGALRTALLWLAAGEALKSVASIGKAMTGLTGKVMAVGAALVLVAAGMDAAFNGSRATKALVDGIGNAFAAMAGVFASFGAGLSKDLSDVFGDAIKQTDDFARQIQNADLLNDDLMKRNAAHEADAATARLSALTAEESKLWDKVDAVGKANSEYLDRLKLIDEIGRKRSMSPDQTASAKRVLAAQTLDDGNPVGALIRDYRQQVAAAGAVSSAQQAINKAIEDRNDLLKQGVDLTDSQFESLKQLQFGLAKMNGDIGNGIERWTAKVGDFNDQMQNAIADGIGGLSDQIANFVTGANADFAVLARSILASFVKISLDSMLKDMFGSIGMDGAKNGQSQAEDALAKLANIGENITTAMTNVYTSGLSINGLPVGAGSFANSPEVAGNAERTRRAVEAVAPANLNQITRAPLADIPGTNVAGRLSDANARIPIEGSAAGLGLRGSLGATGAFGSAADLGLRGTIAPAAAMTKVGEAMGTGFQKVVSAGPGFTAFQQSDGSVMKRMGTFAWRNNNPGNIEAGKYTASQPGYLPGGGRFAAFDTLEHGRAARENLLFNSPGYKNKTLEQAIAKYAPPFENNTKSYTDQLAAAAGVSKNTIMSTMTEQQRRALMMKQEAVEGFRAGRETLISGPNADFGVGRPKQTIPAGIDPTTTQSIDALDAKMSSIGQAAQAASAPLDQFRAANQNLATASTLAGTNVASAGAMATTAGPQFTTAGQALASAGQSASTAAQSAQTATPGLGGFGQGISQLLGPLSSAIPGLGAFGSQIMSLVSSLLSGGGMGGGLLGGLFSEGGYSNSSVARAALPISAWAGAPHFREGTANTSGGGMPAVLHDNEAVIPLSRGRKIPVEMNNDNREPLHGTGAGRARGAGTNNFIFNGVKDADSFRQSKQQIQSQMLGAMHRSAMRNG
ncbi:tape measure protein [Mesorhizobium sp. BH1-1-4]|uniref:tape measure protein n=1 Tax=Mesorhizobium sp. BH1-1-4 TaxID=2876662 RepID=UPI001CD0AAA5|nr:tape measure protein [Mesorhizobium sp. BH1-1-4]MBZ9996590.1 tape measure protein [Mesorhizobium sp. BH1-1-4]